MGNSLILINMKELINGRNIIVTNVKYKPMVVINGSNICSQENINNLNLKNKECRKLKNRKKNMQNYRINLKNKNKRIILIKKNTKIHNLHKV